MCFGQPRERERDLALTPLLPFAMYKRLKEKQQRAEKAEKKKQRAEGRAPAKARRSDVSSSSADKSDSASSSAPRSDSGSRSPSRSGSGASSSSSSSSSSSANSSETSSSGDLSDLDTFVSTFTDAELEELAAIRARRVGEQTWTSQSKRNKKRTWAEDATGEEQEEQEGEERNVFYCQICPEKRMLTELDAQKHLASRFHKDRIKELMAKGELTEDVVQEATKADSRKRLGRKERRTKERKANGPSKGQLRRERQAASAEAMLRRKEAKEAERQALRNKYNGPRPRRDRVANKSKRARLEKEYGK